MASTWGSLINGYSVKRSIQFRSEKCFQIIVLYLLLPKYYIYFWVFLSSMQLKIMLKINIIFLILWNCFFCFINLDKQSCRQHKVPSQNIYFNLENNNTNTYNARHNTDSVIFTTKYNEWYKLIQRFTSWYRA